MLAKRVWLGSIQKVACFLNASWCFLGQTESFVNRKCNQSFWSDVEQRETKTGVSRESAALMETAKNST